jgi:hypothetical protein
MPSGNQQSLAVSPAPAGIHDGYSVASDDETNVGNSVVILRGRVLVNSASNVGSRRNLAHHGCGRSTVGPLRESSGAAEAQAAGEGLVGE